MPETLSPWPRSQFLDNNGRPLVKGKLFTYEAGTNVKRPTYVDSAGITQNTNPVILDYRGECNLWIPPNVPYKYVLAPATDTDLPIARRPHCSEHTTLVVSGIDGDSTAFQRTAAAQSGQRDGENHKTHRRGSLRKSFSGQFMCNGRGRP